MNSIADLMAARYTYAEIAAERDPNQIVYSENDVIEMLQLLGLVSTETLNPLSLLRLRKDLSDRRFQNVPFAQNTVR